MVDASAGSPAGLTNEAPRLGEASRGELGPGPEEGDGLSFRGKKGPAPGHDIGFGQLLTKGDMAIAEQVCSLRRERIHSTFNVAHYIIRWDAKEGRL